MDFRLSDDQLALQHAARRFAASELPELAKTLEETGEPPSHAWLHRYAELGFLGVTPRRTMAGSDCRCWMR